MHGSQTILLILVAALSSGVAQARSFVPFSAKRLAAESDLLLIGKISDMEVSVSTAHVMTRVANVIKARASVEPLQIIASKESPDNPIVLNHQDSDYFGGGGAPFEKGKTYLLFLKRASGGYSAIQMHQGVAPITAGTVNFYFGPVAQSEAVRFIQLSLSTGTSDESWRKFGRDLIDKGDLSDSARSRAIFQMLSDVPNQKQFEHYYLKALDSKNGQVVLSSIRKMVEIESASGLQAVVKLYLKLKASDGWKNYSESYILPYQFKEAFRGDARMPEGSRKIIEQLHKQFPQEKELFEGFK